MSGESDRCLSVYHQKESPHLRLNNRLAIAKDSPSSVSGSGKSTLINELLHPALQHHLTKRVPFPKDVDELKGINAIDKVIIIVRVREASRREANTSRLSSELVSPA
jgi:hypothetical protein